MYLMPLHVASDGATWFCIHKPIFMWRASTSRTMLYASALRRTRGCRLLSSLLLPTWRRPQIGERYYSKSKNEIYQEELEELKQEREALFGFSEEEQSAWANTSRDHKHDANLMDKIRMALEIDDAGGNGKPSTGSPPVDSTAFTHVSEDGQSVHMVDVGTKEVTRRTATAQSIVTFPNVVLEALQKMEHELVGPKGPIFSTAVTAGIMAAKQTSNMIPLCHPLPLEKVDIEINWRDARSVRILCTCKVTHKTGVEMEALTGASIAALTIYDMVKALSHDVQITNTELLHKEGGKRTINKTSL